MLPPDRAFNCRNVRRTGRARASDRRKAESAAFSSVAKLRTESCSVAEEIAPPFSCFSGISRRSSLPPQKLHEALDYLRAERARAGRFRQEMGFLERRRAG